MKNLRRLIPAFVLVLSMLLMFTACSPDQPDAPQQTAEPVTQTEPSAQTEQEITLRVSGAWKDFRAMEWAAEAFNEKYPNCTVVYEYLQGTYADVLKERMLSDGDDRIDLFITTSNIQAGNAMDGYAMDLKSRADLDLSSTFQSLVDNYMYIESDGSPATKLYAIPLGAQMRGLYVNVSLLKSVGIEKVPTNQAELLDACAVLKEAGYVPFHGDPGTFPQHLLYPWICNQIANAENYEEAYNLVNTRDPKATELFREVYEFMYTLVENGYYNYYYTQKTLGLCLDSSTEGIARSLLNITEVLDAGGEGTGEYVKGEGVGQVAFMPNALSTKPTVDKMKDDYHSEIEYVFIPAPVGKEGGYVYLSPADAIAVNKDTQKAEWAIKFLNFLFTPENNEAFAQIFSVMPNTKEAFSYISTLYDVPANHISELGQATFNWSFYRVMTRSTSDPADTRALGAIARSVNPERLDPATNEIYPFEHFWAQFVEEFTTIQ